MARMTSDPDRLARLERVYAAEDRDELARSYAQWVASYDVDVMAMGYQLPGLVAAVTARHVAPNAGPVLDVACGTGLVGALLKPLGYQPLIGIDMSPDMLAAARSRAIYDDLQAMVLGERLGFADDEMAAAVASGVFTAGHAPAHALDELARVVRPGGRIVFSMRADGDHAASYRAQSHRLVEQGRMSLLAETQPCRSFLLSVDEAHVMNVVRVYEVTAPGGEVGAPS